METVKETIDYGQFKVLEGNRPINEAHVRRLMLSFEKGYLKTPIFINKDNEVVDGQHRLEAAKRLSLPVYYLKVNGYGLKEVQQLNTNNSSWGKKDYLISYCKLGLEPYLKLKEFMENYPEFGISTAIMLISDNPTNWGKGEIKDIESGKRYNKTRPFEEGKLEIKNLVKVYENTGKIREYKKFFSGYNKLTFVGVMISLFNNSKFSHELFLKKLELQPTALVQCATRKQYYLLIEDIYNYKNRNKVSLRY